MNYWSMDDDPLSPLPLLSDLAFPPFSTDEDLPTFDAFGDDTNYPNNFADDPVAGTSGGSAGFNGLNSPLLFENLSDLIDNLAALPKNNSVNENPQPTEKDFNESFIAKSPDIDDPTIFINDAQFIETGQSLDDGQLPVEFDGISGLDEAQTQLFDGIPYVPIDDLNLIPTNNLSSGIKSFVVRSSDENNTTNFTNGGGFIQTGQSLVLTVSPFLYQHARYKSDLKKKLRYTTILNDDAIALEISDVQNIFIPGISCWMRITRITIAYGDDNKIFLHPYPIWLNDEHAKVHNGSLFIPVTEQITKIGTLVIERSEQDDLKTIQQFTIFKSTELEFSDVHPINTNTPKHIISQYQLKYFVLHFQIFLVDENNQAYPTDLQCQTEPIYEYDPKELKSLPPIVRDVHKHSIKRKQIGQRNKSRLINKKLMALKCSRG